MAQVRGVSARTRLIVAGMVGLVSGALVALLGAPTFALAAGWGLGSAVYVAWVWSALGRMSGEETRAHALIEDNTRRGAHLALVLAAVASLGALVVTLTFAAHAASPVRQLLTAAGLVTVALSWLVIHTLYAARYAHLHYTDPRDSGVDFGTTASPDYRDFAYLAFTVGMTYQVSDTTLRSPRLRRTALAHGMLSFLFGAFVLATTINLVAGLAAG